MIIKNNDFMNKYFWQPILAWFGGLAICIIITSVVFKIGWQNPQEILIWGYGLLASASLFAWGAFSQRRKEEKKELDDRFRGKASTDDIDSLKCQMDMLRETLNLIHTSQEEVHTTVDNIWGKLVDMNGENVKK
jgi:hypothetical protein